MIKTLAYLLLLMPPLAVADPPQGGLTFSATLGSIKVTARPGQVVTRHFKLTLDPHARAVHFKARVEDWWKSQDGSQSVYDVPGTLRRSCGMWTSINPVESAVEPGGTLDVKVTTTVPVELQPGGYWCALTVDEVPDPLAAPADVGIQFVASVSTGIFINIEPVTRSAEILDLQVQSGDVVLRVRNEGNTPLGIEGQLEFFARGAALPAATVRLARATLLPEPFTDGGITTKLPPAADLPTGRYRVRAVLDIGADHDIGAERDIDIVRSAVTRGPVR